MVGLFVDVDRVAVWLHVWLVQVVVEVELDIQEVCACQVCF